MQANCLFSIWKIKDFILLTIYLDGNISTYWVMMLSKPIVDHINKTTSSSVHPYIDDFLTILLQDKLESKLEFLKIINILTSHGFKINEDKLVKPAKIIPCLGTILNTDRPYHKQTPQQLIENDPQWLKLIPKS